MIFIFLLLMFHIQLHAGLPINLDDLEDCGIIVVHVEQEITEEFEAYLQSLNEQAERTNPESPEACDVPTSDRNTER